MKKCRKPLPQHSSERRYVWPRPVGSPLRRRLVSWGSRTRGSTSGARNCLPTETKPFRAAGIRPRRREEVLPVSACGKQSCMHHFPLSKRYTFAIHGMELYCIPGKEATLWQRSLLYTPIKIDTRKLLSQEEANRKTKRESDGEHS